MSEIFLEILNTGIVAGWLVLAVLVVRLLLKKAPAWTKCALWAIVAVRLVWPFSIESMVSLVPSAQTLPPSELYNFTPQVHTGISSLNSAINPTFTQTFESQMTNSVNPLQVAVAIASVVWVVGMAVMVVYTAVSYLRLRRSVRVSMPLGDDVYLCDQVSSPFILGIIKPKIYLPSDLPQEKWDKILAHERAHLARRDHWWKPLGFGLLTVFWFHPLLWVGYILLCRDVELACDEKVIRSLSADEKQAYSAVLLECSVPKRWITACPLAFGETGVKQRIKAVLHYKKPTLWILLAALIIGTVLAVCFLTEPIHYAEISTSKPIGIYVRQLGKGYFVGTDEDGNEWKVKARAEDHWLNYIVWITTDGAQITQAPTQDAPGSYVVKPDTVWDYKDSDLSRYGIAHDVGSFDIDNDGVLEQCVLSFGPTSGFLTFELSVWSGDRCEASVIFYSSTAFNRAAFFVEDGTLKILAPDIVYQAPNWHMHVYDVTFVDGELIVSEDGKPLQTLQQTSFSGGTYTYEKEGCGSGDFTITLREDGTFSYYEGMLSSHIGFGNWVLRDEKLYLYETGTGSKTRTYVFLLRDDSVAFQASESDSFTYVNVADGDKFYAANTPSAPHPTLEQQTLMWVTIEEEESGYFYAIDTDGNRWRILDADGVDGNKYTGGECWVVYSLAPKTVNETLPDGRMVRYEVEALRHWRFLEQADIGYDLFGSIYDLCVYDIDDDGILETCILSAGPTSGLLTYTLTVMQGDVCEYSAIFRSNATSVGVAFSANGDGLQAVMPVSSFDRETKTFFTVGMRAYEISVKDGQLMVTDSRSQKLWP